MSIVTETKVFEGAARWDRKAYVVFRDNQVVFDNSAEEYGPISFDIQILRAALKSHDDGLKIDDEQKQQ